MMALGLFLLSGMGPDTDYLTVVRNMIIVGLGMGPTMPVFTLAAQNAVKMNQLGVVTSLTQFSRSIGSTLGVAIFGSLLTNRFAPAFQAALPPEVAAVVPPDQLAQFQNPQALLNPQAADAMRQTAAAAWTAGRPGLRRAVRGDQSRRWSSALHDVFLLGAVLAALGVVTVLFLRSCRCARATVRRPPRTASPTAPPRLATTRCRRCRSCAPKRRSARRDMLSTKWHLTRTWGVAANSSVRHSHSACPSRDGADHPRGVAADTLHHARRLRVLKMQADEVEPWLDRCRCRAPAAGRVHRAPVGRATRSSAENRYTRSRWIRPAPVHRRAAAAPRARRRSVPDALDAGRLEVARPDADERGCLAVAVSPSAAADGCVHGQKSMKHASEHHLAEEQPRCEPVDAERNRAGVAARDVGLVRWPIPRVRFRRLSCPTRRRAPHPTATGSGWCSASNGAARSRERVPRRTRARSAADSWPSPRRRCPPQTRPPRWSRCGTARPGARRA